MALQIGKIGFGDADQDGDVEVEIESFILGTMVNAYLKQDQIQQVIDHLQAQILNK